VAQTSYGKRKLGFIERLHDADANGNPVASDDTANPSCCGLLWSGFTCRCRPISQDLERSRTDCGARRDSVPDLPPSPKMISSRVCESCPYESVHECQCSRWDMSCLQRKLISPGRNRSHANPFTSLGTRWELGPRRNDSAVDDPRASHIYSNGCGQLFVLPDGRCLLMSFTSALRRSTRMGFRRGGACLM